MLEPFACTYTPPVGFLGTDTFTYTVSDGHGGTDTATVTVKVVPNTAPDAQDDVLLRVTHPNAPFTIFVAGNDVDVDARRPHDHRRERPAPRFRWSTRH